jgi:NAD(P)-dependent dehydrogenase (short-subunit alcohol dehydrogenase family)
MYWPSLFAIPAPKAISLKEKRVWIIGASSGIGEALAFVCAAEGASVAVSARRRSRLEQIAESLPGSGHLALALDVTDAPGFARSWEALQTEWGIPDVIFYTAGIYEAPDFMHFTATDSLRTTDVHINGVFRLLEQILPSWGERRSGWLVLFDSLSGLQGGRGVLAYGAAKAAARHLAESLKQELAPLSIQVQLVCPGTVDTPLRRAMPFKMPLKQSPLHAAQHIRRQLGRRHIFTIDTPWLYVRFIKLLHWLLPHSVYGWFMRQSQKY